MPTQTKTYRYQLPAKAIKIDCPQCGHKHRKTLSRYIDTKTGEPLPEVYGRCDRASNCGYDFNPYRKGPSSMSYADEVRDLNQMQPIPRLWFSMAGKQKRNGINKQCFVETLVSKTSATPEQAEYVAHYIYGQPVPTKPATRLICTIPDEVFSKSIGHYGQNQFARLLTNRFGTEQARTLLDRFQIGTSARWPGACVFWYIDEKGRKRGGQIKLFDEDWHTAKYKDREGKLRSKTDWVHTALRYRLEKSETSLPDWLISYIENADCSPCMFGLPQLNNAPIDQPIAIVEAPKTAVVCSAFVPEFVWLAVGALSYLNADRLAPLRGRKIILYPDLNAYADRVNNQRHKTKGWISRADELRANGFNVEVSSYLEQHATDEQRAAGLDLADFLLSEPIYVKSIAEQQTRPGFILRPDESQLERLIANPTNEPYPADWDAPNDASDRPTIRVRHYEPAKTAKTVE